MEKRIIEKIIEAGNLAPSGGNSQPWEFVVKDNNSISVIALPEKDHRILNYKNRGTYVAHGALVENMEIAATHFGFDTKTEFFPKEKQSVRFTFHPSKISAPATDLYEDIARRHSNRKPFKTDPLSVEEKNYLFQEITRFPGCQLATVEGKGKIDKVAENLAFDVLISLQNQLLHSLLFQEILWEEGDQKVRPGLYIKTMEVAPPKAFVFKMLRNWKTAQLFAKIKFLQKIYEENAKTAASAGLIGAITVKDSDVDFIHAGRALENIWLRAAKLGLEFQMMTGILFLWQQVALGKHGAFSEEEGKVVKGALENLREALGVHQGIIAFTFRIGRGSKPTAVSHKRPPQIRWE